jgi:hypothetical protein
VLGRKEERFKRRNLEEGEKMVFKSVLVCLMVCLVLLGFPVRGSWAGISISPAFVELSLDKGRPAGQFLISNLGEEEERYRIKTIHFSFSKDGGVQRIPVDEHSLAPWIKFNPTEFSLAPKTNRAVRFVIAPQGNLRPGEYWAAMELESLKTTTATGKDEAGREFQFEVSSSILVPIFGKFGNVRYKGTLKEIKVTPQEAGQRIELLAQNTGEGRLLLDGQYTIRNSSGQEVQKGSIGKAYVLPGFEQIFSHGLAASLPEGNYKVRVECHSPQLQQSLVNEFDLALKPPL